MNDEEVRLVVVDDDVDAAAVLAELLQLEGYSVWLQARTDPSGNAADFRVPEGEEAERLREALHNGFAVLRYRSSEPIFRKQDVQRADAREGRCRLSRLR